MKNSIIVALAILGVAGCSSASGDVQEADTASTKLAAMETMVLSRAKAESTDEEWGTFVKYFEGETRGTRELLSGIAEIKPGLEIHPPHKHAEEEFLMVLEGTGEWTVGEKVTAAEAGDMLYSRPWDVHGIRNTGDTTLQFVFWKWNSKGLDTPVESE